MVTLKIAVDLFLVIISMFINITITMYVVLSVTHIIATF